MTFWKRPSSRVPVPPAGDTRQAKLPRKTTGRRSPPVPLEVRLLAMEALGTDLTLKEVADIIGVSSVTLGSWRKLYQEGGVEALYRKPATTSARKQCSVLEQRILAYRQEHPECGVRRIRDDLRRQEGLEVSAEKVRQTVNDAGLGNPPVEPHRRPAKVRRFERALPNALWQIDIFTFQLKRMYPVYLIGIIDDHSRFMVGWGLFRQQTAEAVLEVVNGAVGQWGAPREILSDNGRQFVAWRGKSRFQKVLKRQGIGHVRSAPQHPMTLGKIERFWQTIWREFLEEAVFASFADACQRLDHWMQYYNHQRPHQGLDGGCPADRFYGIAGDVEEAVRQGCKENSLRLALGQQTQPPLYLLGQLGATDVRVVRRGEDIEVKVGDAVREVIRLGAPYRIEEGCDDRTEETAAVAGSDRTRAVPGDRADTAPGGEHPGAVPDVRSQPADAVPGGGAGGQSRGLGAGGEAPWPEACGRAGAAGARAGDPEQGSGEAAGEDDAEIRGGPDPTGLAAAAGPRGAAPRREKNPAPAGTTNYEDLWWSWVDRNGGRGQ